MGENPLQPAARLTSLDAYRGFIMLFMATWGFRIGLPNGIASQFPDNPIWQFFGTQFGHSAWAGCSAYDLIQPSFMFMVGVAMPYSHASRLARSESRLKIASHVVYRALILVLLGVFLATRLDQGRGNFTFDNVLAQIGLGYAFVYVLVGRGVIVQLLTALAILGGYWYLFYDSPLAVSGVIPANWLADDAKEHYVAYEGLFAHWNKYTNFAAAVDQHFLKLFAPFSSSYPFNHGGYQTLNFVPSMVTMIFGLMAGELLRSTVEAVKKLKILVAAAIVCWLIGFVLDLTVCPSVKRIWTPSWAIFSTGWTLALLAGFYGVIDLKGHKRWAFPLVVVGMNSIAMYCMAQLIHGWVGKTVAAHFETGRELLLKAFDSTSVQGTAQKLFGQSPFANPYGPIVQTCGTVLVLWLICLWMYRRGIFLRI